MFTSGLSPILAYGLSQLHGKGGLAGAYREPLSERVTSKKQGLGWRWIYIVEGLITVGLAVGAWFVIVDL